MGSLVNFYKLRRPVLAHRVDQEIRMNLNLQLEGLVESAVTLPYVHLSKAMAVMVETKLKQPMSALISSSARFSTSKLRMRNFVAALTM